MIDINKTVAVTGADGFIGSHLVEALLSRGFRVRALAQYNSFNNWGWLEDVVRNRPEGDAALEIMTGDVRDANFCREFVKGCGTVFHLAALIAIPFSYVAPDSYVDTNVKGTLNMCQAARDAGIDRLVVTSTSEVYGTAQYVPIPEAHPRQPSRHIPPLKSALTPSRSVSTMHSNCLWLSHARSTPMARAKVPAQSFPPLSRR